MSKIMKQAEEDQQVKKVPGIILRLTQVHEGNRCQSTMLPLRRPV